eukprot:468864-Amphidinium_carterae.1
MANLVNHSALWTGTCSALNVMSYQDLTDAVNAGSPGLTLKTIPRSRTGVCRATVIKQFLQHAETKEHICNASQIIARKGTDTNNGHALET